MRAKESEDWRSRLVHHTNMRHDLSVNNKGGVALVCQSSH